MQTSFYESDRAVSEYLFFHYGSKEDQFFNGIGPSEALGFARRCGLLHERYSLDRNRALDLGCAVGGASFALSESFAEVVGIDFSHSLIASAQRLARNREATIDIATEGDLTRSVNIAIPATARSERVRFSQGDAMELDPELGTFDFILMANLIDRLPNPRQCLRRIDSFLNKRGILAITSPYTWLEEYTPRPNWLGGYLDNGKAVRTADQLTAILSPLFEPLDSQDLPFLIREHERKNQYSVAHATIWRKR